MRSNVIYVVVLAIVGMFACEQKVDVAAEKEAIKEAIQHEFDAWIANDYEDWSTSWVHAPYIVKRETVGWDSLSAEMKKSMETYETARKEPDKNRVDEATESNFDIHLNGNIAFVFCDGHIKGIWDGEPLTMDWKVVKYLVKEEGKWKLVTVFDR